MSASSIYDDQARFAADLQGPTAFQVQGPVAVNRPPKHGFLGSRAFTLVQTQALDQHRTAQHLHHVFGEFIRAQSDPTAESLQFRNAWTVPRTRRDHRIEAN